MDLPLSSTFLLLFLAHNSTASYLDLLYYPDGSTFTKLTGAENDKLQETCGTAKRPTFSGHARFADPGRFPWAAAVFRLKEGEKIDDAVPVCGASIISKRHLISAAHCFTKVEGGRLHCEKEDDVKFKIGYGGVCAQAKGNCKAKDLTYVDVKMYAEPKGYQEKECSEGYDFAVIEVSEEISFDDEKTQPACLMRLTNTPNALEEIRTETNARIMSFYIAAWGRTESDASSPELRFIGARYGEITVQPDKFDFYPDTQIGDKWSRICTGDSGSGLVGEDSYNKGKITLVGHATQSADAGCEREDRASGRFMLTSSTVHLTTVCDNTGVCPKLLEAPKTDAIKVANKEPNFSFSSKVEKMWIFSIFYVFV